MTVAMTLVLCYVERDRISGSMPGYHGTGYLSNPLNSEHRSRIEDEQKKQTIWCHRAGDKHMLCVLACLGSQCLGESGWRGIIGQSRQPKLFGAERPVQSFDQQAVQFTRVDSGAWNLPWCR